MVQFQRFEQLVFFGVFRIGILFVMSSLQKLKHYMFTRFWIPLANLKWIKKLYRQCILHVKKSILEHDFV